MVSEIRIYIEGDPALRPGFGQFLDRVRSMAREKRIRWDIILCGRGFNEKRIPKRKNVEEIDRKDLVDALVHASKNTSKSSYHKVRHGEKILAHLDETRVRARAAHCDRLFTMLEGLRNPSSTKEESTSGEIDPHSEVEIQSQSPLSEKIEKKEHEHG